MRPHSFLLKLFLGNLLLVGVIVAVGGGVSYRVLNASYRQENEQHQNRIAEIAQIYFEQHWPEADTSPQFARKQVHQQVRRLFREATMRLTVIGRDGTVLGDSQADPVSMANHRTQDRPEVIQALQGQPRWDRRISETLDKPFRYLGLPIRRGGDVLGVVRVAMPVRAIAESQQFIANALLWSGLTAVLAAVVLALLISWIWYSPLRQITSTARVIASGDLDTRAKVAGRDELAQLARALNEMRDRIARHIATIAAQRENLQTVVANLREGVAALDAEGRIVFMNRSARELLTARGEQNVHQRHLQEVVRIPSVVEAAKELAQADAEIDRQVEVDIRGQRRVLSLHGAPVGWGATPEIRSLLVVRDITDLARAAAMKAEFAANASHELRTPLATIRAVVESLSAAGPEDEESFKKLLDMLQRQVGRLEDMTNDLLDLHKVEMAGYRIRRERIGLDELADWVQSQFAEKLQDNGLELTTVADEGVQLKSDRMLIQMILQNLLDNAAKFTPHGGRISLELHRTEGQVQMRVSDTGCGIAPEMQSRVFERFFQADPSRSGDTRVRGTGLGLAIVKHAADRLGAKLSLKSELQRGTTFTISLPD